MLKRNFLLGAGLLGTGMVALGSIPAKVHLVTRTHRGRRWTCLSVDPARQTLGLFLSGDTAVPLRTFPALERYLAKLGRRLVLAMNAGMFEADGSPVGWCVVQGKNVKGPNMKSGEGNFFLKPNGVFALQEGKALVRETSAAVGILDKASFITQSGPLLLTGGQLHPAFQENSTNRLIRNAVGVTVNGTVWFAISEEPVSFHETATLFRDELHCPDALYLDGVVSRLHAPGLGRIGGTAALGPLLAVTEAIP